MKKLAIFLTLSVSLPVFAEELKTYDCAAPAKGSQTVDKITLRANPENLVLNFPGFGVDEKYTASFDRESAANVPAVLQNRSGGEYYANKNPKSLVTKRSEYTPMYAFATNGILRADDSGKLIIIYKHTEKRQSSTNLNQWSREYACIARD